MVDSATTSPHPVLFWVEQGRLIRPWHWTVATTGPGGQWIRKSTGPPKNPLALQKHVITQQKFAAWIYDFTCEVTDFCTLGLYITKKKYQLMLPSEFCRFPVKNNGGIRSTKKKKKKKKNHWPRGPAENKLWWPELARQPQKGMRASGHIANTCQGLLMEQQLSFIHNTFQWAELLISMVHTEEPGSSGWPMTWLNG